ncbi:MAG: MFS transporter, partial [Pseudomonadota bacterium]|nr:MFS transporter [Pseudomonadota bacterium]
MASSNSLVERLGRRFFYGWVIVGVGMLGIFASGPAQSHTFSVFIGPIALDLGLTQTEMASAYGLATLMAALCLPAMGWFLDRAGAKRMLAVVALLFGSACAAFGLVGGLFWLAIGFAALRFLGQGSL